jgi:hypothetical protein
MGPSSRARSAQRRARLRRQSSEQWLERFGLEPTSRPAAAATSPDNTPGWRVRPLNAKAGAASASIPRANLRGDGGYACSPCRNGAGRTTPPKPAPYPLEASSIHPADLCGCCGSTGSRPNRVDRHLTQRVAVATTSWSTARSGCREGEHRNATGFWLATQLRDNGHTEADARHALAAYRASSRPSTPTATVTVHACGGSASVRQAYSHPPRDPWTATPSTRVRHVPRQVRTGRARARTGRPRPADRDVASLRAGATAGASRHPSPGRPSA